MMKKDCALIKDFLNYKTCYDELKSSSGFSKASDIYLSTNENLNKSIPKDCENKKILTVTASGDQLLNFIGNKATDITSFDCNVFTKYYSRFKLLMIKAYDYNTFINKYTFIQDMFILCCDEKQRRLLNDALNEIYNDIYEFLTKKEKKFWKVVFSLYNDDFFMIDRLFIPAGEKILENNAIYNEETYNFIKNNIDNCNIKYVDSDIISLSNNFDDEEFDIIYASNIIEYLGVLDERKVLRDFHGILKPNGKIIEYCLKRYKKAEDNLSLSINKVLPLNTFYKDENIMLDSTKGDHIITYTKI